MHAGNLCVSGWQRTLPSLRPASLSCLDCCLVQVAAAQQVVSAKEAELAKAVAARSDVEQQLDRLTQHLDVTEAQLQEAQAAKFKAEVRKRWCSPGRTAVAEALQFAEALQ